MSSRRRVVIDTNVVVAGLRSRKGASYLLLAEVGQGRFEIALSVPLVLEYEDVLLRHTRETGLAPGDVAAVLDYFCAVGHLQEIFFLWRPLLRDPKDDMVLELAVAAGCGTVVTYNTGDFAGAEQFGVEAIRPATFLKRVGVLP